MPVLEHPDRGGQVDDEEVVGVNHETDTADGVELEVVLGHDFGETAGFVLLLVVLLLVGVVRLDVHSSLRRLRASLPGR